MNETALVAATASADFSAKVWNALTGDETHSFQHKHIVRTVTFSKLQPHLLTAGDLSITLFYITPVPIPKARGFHADGQAYVTDKLFTAGHEKLIRIYDLEKPDSEPDVLPTAPDKIRSAVFTNNDQQLLTSYIDNSGVRYAPVLRGYGTRLQQTLALPKLTA